MGFTYVAGFLFNIVLCFCMGNYDDIMSSDYGNPVAQIFYNSLGKSGGVFYTVCAFIILQFVCWAATQALARTFFAFARDRLIPLSKLWTRINKRTGTPLYAVWISIFWYVLHVLLPFFCSLLVRYGSRSRLGHVHPADACG